MRFTAQVLVGLLAWGALSFGAVYPWGYWPLAAGALILGARLLIATRAWRDARPRRLMLAFGSVAVAIALQVVPLPYEWFRDVAPASDAVLSQLQVGWNVTSPAYHATSIAPASTVTALILFVSFSLLIVGLMRGVSFMPLEWMITQLTVFGLLMAVFAIAQRVVAGPGTILVYGFWRPSGNATPFGPFINRNHFAGWMVLVVPLALAAAAAQAQAARGPFVQSWREWFGWLLTPDASRFVFSTISVLIMVVALVLSGSRSGLISAIVALGVLGYLASRRQRGRLKRVLPPIYLGLLVIVAIGWVGVERTVARFGDAREEFGERLMAWKDTVHIARDFYVAGTGFGGYGDAMLVYQTAARHSFYAQAHNEYLQIAAEGGLLVGVPAAILAIVLVRRVRQRLRGQDPPVVFWMRAGAVAGLVGIAAQSLLDFSLQMPGNAMMFAVILAIALHQPASSSHAHRV
jgi:O-antigen ligase